MLFLMRLEICTKKLINFVTYKNLPCLAKTRANIGGIQNRCVQIRKVCFSVKPNKASKPLTY